MARDPAHAGELRERVRFYRRTLDANGDPLGPFAALFEVPAKIDANPAPWRGDAQRLEGVAPIVVTIRASVQARTIDASMGLVWLFTGEKYLIRSPPALNARRAWLEILALAHAGGEGWIDE